MQAEYERGFKAFQDRTVEAETLLERGKEKEGVIQRNSKRMQEHQADLSERADRIRSLLQDSTEDVKADLDRLRQDFLQAGKERMTQHDSLCQSFKRLRGGADKAVAAAKEDAAATGDLHRQASD